MKGYKLTNPDNTIFGFFNNKDSANYAATCNLQLRGTVLKMEEVEMPEFEIEHYDYQHFNGDVLDVEAESIEKLKKTVADMYENDDAWHDGDSIAFGYTENDDEVFVQEAL